MFEALDYIERTYSEKEHYYNKHHQHRMDIVNYLLPYVKNKEMFELKIMASSSWGVTRIKEQLMELDKTSVLLGKKDLQALEQNVAREISMSIDLSFFRSAKQCFKETAKSQPLLFVPHPPLKKYSFRQRQTPSPTSTRPTSCNNASKEHSL